MALITTRTVHERGSGNSFSQEYYVYNDDSADLDATTAETAGLLQFNSDFGVIANDHNSERVSDHSWRVIGMITAKSPGTLDAPDKEGPEKGGTKRTRFNFQARSRLVKNTYKTLSITVSPLWAVLLENVPAGGPFGGLVNVTQSGSVGFQLNAPSPTFTEEYTFKNDRITDAYIRKLEGLCSTGIVNSVDFLGYEKGEILLSTCHGGKISDDTWQLSFGFALAKNESNVLIDEEQNFRVPFKGGHDHLWTYDERIFKEIPAIGAGLNVMSPVFAMVEQVWKYGDLNDIFIVPKPTQEF